MYILAVIGLQKGGDMTLLDDKNELVRLGMAKSEQLCFFMTKSLSAEETHEILLQGEPFPIFFATRMGHSLRTKRKIDSPTSSKDLIVNLKIQT